MVPLLKVREVPTKYSVYDSVFSSLLDQSNESCLSRLSHETNAVAWEHLAGSHRFILS